MTTWLLVSLFSLTTPAEITTILMIPAVLIWFFTKDDSRRYVSLTVFTADKMIPRMTTWLLVSLFSLTPPAEITTILMIPAVLIWFSTKEDSRRYVSLTVFTADKMIPRITT